ncbi:bZIP transcription factor [Fibrisoma montanum]|uniref:BZIP transcription factor n=2 Tax=Fibrisoma montanum TaxID=2305895 RepID=A0A418MK01_9BACT|nr:bZIP transcription factor [Fibrisoma montanum]
MAGSYNTTGSDNTFVGRKASVFNSTGINNVSLGANSGFSNTTGSYNLMLGSKAGYTNQSGHSNTFVGFQADATANNLENATAIGANAKVSQSNSIVLGSGVNVGIGTSVPQAKLEINSDVAGQSGLRLTQLTAASASTITTNKYLTVDASGNVVLGSTAVTRGRLADTQDLWQKTGQYAQSTGTDGVIIGSLDKTPAGYKLYVQEGILTEKVKVAIKDTDQWSDKVFSPTYNLTPLAEVEQYVKTNKHLPGIPSAEEVVHQGVDVGQMDAKLLEKIEELTLYIISQQKELAVLRQQVTNLTKTIKH